MKDSTTTIVLGHGHLLQLQRRDGADDTLEVRAPNGEIELAIIVTVSGPKLRLRAVDLEIEATQSLRIKCERFEVEADHEARITSPRGGIALFANDDVDVKGERILLNADAQPLPVAWDELKVGSAGSSPKSSGTSQ